MKTKESCTYTYILNLWHPNLFFETINSQFKKKSIKNAGNNVQCFGWMFLRFLIWNKENIMFHFLSRYPITKQKSGPESRKCLSTQAQSNFLIVVSIFFLKRPEMLLICSLIYFWPFFQKKIGLAIWASYYRYLLSCHNHEKLENNAILTREFLWGRSCCLKPPSNNKHLIKNKARNKNTISNNVSALDH